MSHIGFVNIPALGHLYPTLPVVSELVRRGHRVSYLATAPRAGLIRAAGATVIEHETLRPGDADPSATVPERADHIGRSLLNFLAETRLTLPALTEAFDADPVDLVAFDRMAFAGHVYAAQRKLPMVQLWPMMLPTAKGMPFDPENPFFLRYLDELTTFLAAEEVPLTAEEFLAPQTRRDIAFLPRYFQHFEEQFGEGFAFVGPSLGERPDQPRWTPPASGRPVALVTLGSLNNRHPGFFKLVIEALADSPWHVVIAIGMRFDASILGSVPAHIELLPVVPQLQVLAHAKVFVSHAGLGGIMESIHFGVPQVAIARTAEQDVNAARVEELGMGLRLTEATLTPATLRSAMDTVANDPVMAGDVIRLQELTRAAGGARVAADAIEECL